MLKGWGGVGDDVASLDDSIISIYSFQRGRVKLPTYDHVKCRVPSEALLEASQDRVRVIDLT
jgi:hypothetical protein